MKRLMYRAAYESADEAYVMEAVTIGGAGQAMPLVDSGILMTVAIYRWNNQLFLYCECVQERIEPDELFPELAPWLKIWPGGGSDRRWVPMADVFHFNEPAGPEHWRRRAPVERRVGRIAHLKPEMIASYIYYHYQLQEERAFSGGKYEIIGIHENVLFGYQEFPQVVEEPVLPPKLHTKGTPPNWEDARMDLHFQPWPDGHLYFKPIESLFAYYNEGEGNAR
ncbi:hypothetical protein DNH61_01855 [Paenibacillus sambharensis]|uniref:Uncharacterized protein n=1 Tax=Paenibacillus sambharensis TaxID=1803190 RepID=A0A2W1LBP6_9BACL|nr:hypothetical protein [Paenibacillus sambharensis]PZD97638.1 hypothetical protein DNH61_01855 [Paenibacillus sambharensis]